MPDPSQYRVAIVVTAYKQADFLPACLASLEAHGLEGVQVILVENGSGDGSAEIMEAWSNRQAHPIELLLSPTNLGHTAAFNLAVSRVKAPYVLDMAGDDELPPNSLDARILALEATPDAAFCHGNAVYIDSIGKTLGYEHPPGERNPAWEGWVWQRLFEGRFICPSSVLFRTSALREVEGYDTSLGFEDFDIWMRLSRNHPIAYVPDVVSRHRLHPGSATASQVRRRNQATLNTVLIICQKAYQMSRADAERTSIGRFARYHMRLAAYTGQPIWVSRFRTWLEESQLPTGPTFIWDAISHLPLGNLYGWYSERKVLGALHH